MNLLNLFSKQNKLKAKKNLYSHYEKVSEDIKKGKKDEGVWTKAFANSDGDLQKTKANYIELMVEKTILEKEAKNEQQKSLELERLKEVKQEKENSWQKLKAEIDYSFDVFVFFGINTGRDLLAFLTIYVAIVILEMRGTTKLFTSWFPIFFPEKMHISIMIMFAFMALVSLIIVSATKKIFRK